MTKQNIFIMAGFFSFFTSCKTQHNDRNSVVETNLDKFKAGQIWKYHNRLGEDSSTLTILKIETYEKADTIIHIRVDGVKIYNPNAASGYSNFLGHLPFSEKTISKSVTMLGGQNDNIPDFAEGYNEWKKAWDIGKSGYWTIDLKDAIEAVDSSMRQIK